MDNSESISEQWLCLLGIFCHNCSVEKNEFKTGEDVLEVVEKFSNLGDMFSLYGGTS